VTVNPLVNWIWFGFGIMALGTGIALLPERAFSFAASRFPEGAATTSLLFLIVAVGLATAPLHAQHVDSAQTVPTVPRSEAERELDQQIVCMCGGCGRKVIGSFCCSVAAEMRDEVSALIADGKSKDEVFAYFIDKYGSQEPLAMPLDEGFNRLAWLFPYLLGISGAIGVGAIALRWSLREAAEKPLAAGVPTEADAQLMARLDDELRDLD
jgi:cytochrome c-type biogenesis protein CcmH/NrfF